jgi:hypothetical protein
LIDGSKGEGGGQILRNAISYANILAKPAIQVQADRNPVSKPSMLQVCDLPAKYPAGEAMGDYINFSADRPVFTANGSGSYRSFPSERHLKDIAGTAGSICFLLLQAKATCVPCWAQPLPRQLILKEDQRHKRASN